MHKIQLMLITLSFFALYGCLSDAPRDNILDGNSGEGLHSIEGTVLTYYPRPPRSTLSGASVTINELQTTAITNEDGNFEFKNIPDGDYTLTCLMPGFMKDSTSITVPENNPIEFLLDGMPYFEDIRISSYHISRWFPFEDMYYLQLETICNDSDGVEELDDCWFEIPYYGISDTLTETSTAGQFLISLFPEDMPLGSLHQLDGREFIIHLRDNFGAVKTSNRNYMTRIIETTPVLSSPADWQSIESFPVDFTWEPLFLQFEFSLKIEIFRIISGFNIKVDEVTGIDPAETSYTYTNNLDAGEYFWALFIVDDFGNESRSKEGSFLVL